ncbi:OmpA family protein [Hymenobacter sp. BT18]|uniref:OmpA family protein n=1 Tax=Hymenobacter sp. BT18 TaxID=2835648 RepID=UPI00143ECA56|nr:OmpA family protein [Hymenobacter sp. BT18]QIX63328.1 OmpA family protein [Hymenobacter sp. BT18]
MKGFLCGLMLLLVLAGTATGQDLTGIWQGVEVDAKTPEANWPTVLRLQRGKGSGLFGVLYQEVGAQPGTTVTFQVRATANANGFRLEHLRKLNETGATPFSYWCAGAITFTYDAAQEKLTGRATYDPVGTCDHGSFSLYRVKLKSAASVPAATQTTIRVSGRDVRWYADASLKQPLTTGNTYRTKLSKTTTFYLVQGYYRTPESAVVPITVRVNGTVATQPKPAPSPAPDSSPAPVSPPASATPDTTRPAPLLSATPLVLPTVLFRQGTAELLPGAQPALAQLAAELLARPDLKLQVAGHTDRLGEPEKNLVLSEQRAEAVKAYLVKAGVAPERVSTIGYGDARPLYPSPDARNRRVEVNTIK